MGNAGKRDGEMTFGDILGDQPEKEPVFRKSQKKDRTDLLDRTPVVFVDAGHGGNDGGCLKEISSRRMLTLPSQSWWRTSSTMQASA